MPSATKYIAATHQERNVFHVPIVSERTRRRMAYRKAIDYYNGQHTPQLTGDESTYNTYINMVKMTADRTVSFLFPDMPVVELDPNSIEPTNEEIWVKKLLDYNGGLSLLTKLGLRGFLSGHNFVKIVPGNPYPKIISLDPNSVTMFWRADDINDVLWYEVRYYAQGRIWIQDYVKIEDDLWAIVTYKTRIRNQELIGQAPGNVGEANATLDYLEFGADKFEHESTALHTSKIPPIVAWSHYPNPDDIYGAGEFNQSDLQDLINRIASERNRIIRENSDPVDVLIGADADEIESHSNMYAISNPSAKVTRLQMNGDLTGLNNVLDKLIETYLSIARVVLLKGEAKDLQRVTNASVRTLFLDALAKNQVLQDVYKRSLSHIIRLCLEMAYADGEVEINPDTIDITIGFASPLPVDMTEVVNTVNIAMNAGVMSKRTGRIKLNLDPAFEQAAITAEREDDRDYMIELTTQEDSDNIEIEENNE